VETDEKVQSEVEGCSETEAWKALSCMVSWTYCTGRFCFVSVFRLLFLPSRHF
jgi:hypothetical protein